MKLLKAENLILFLMVFALACVSGYFVNFSLKLIYGDALVRSFHAYLVFFGNDPKISSIGFVWPPLQTLLQLPLVLIKPLNVNGFAGNILTSIFLGLSIIYMNRLGIFFKVNRVFRFIVLLLFATNPLIFFYGINGMSEIIGITFVLMTLYYFLKHIATKKIPPLILSSSAFGLAVMTRWEMGMLLGIILLLIGALSIFKKGYTLKESESTAIMFLTPISFVVFLWLIASWLVVGSPTYFLHSTYSFTPQDAKNLASIAELSEAKGNIVLTSLYAFKRVILLSFPFLPLILLMFLKLFNKQTRIYTLTLLGFALTVVFSQMLPLYAGKSYGQLRYFMYAIPFSYIFFMYLFNDTLKLATRKFLTIILFSVFAIALLASSSLTLNAMSYYGNREESTIAKLILDKNHTFRNEAYENEEVISQYITTYIKGRILVDDSLGFNIIYISKKPNLFISSTDYDIFKFSKKDPVKSDATHILITDPETASGVDTVSLTYPKMFKNGASFVTLEKDFGSWRLYKIIK